MLISPTQVKELRAMTGSPIMDCKKALQESQGDLEKAKLVLRKKGQILVNKKSLKETKEGLVSFHIDRQTNKAGMIKLACQTDFVSMNEKFQSAAENLSRLVASSGEKNFIEQEIDGISVKDYINNLIIEIHENILLTDLVHWEWGSDSVVGSYLHSNQKIGVLVELMGVSLKTENEILAKDIAIHIAANTVMAIDESEIEPQVLEKEKAFLMEQAMESGKPENIAQKMIVGRLQKFKKEICLLEQPFVKDLNISVKELLKRASNEQQTEIKIKRFVKFNF